ncbi:MAG: toprim domain-containing protein [Euryarchaeota archaeon]|nr:toprim domain-containing protein [Euryarchaeota archaeon]
MGERAEGREARRRHRARVDLCLGVEELIAEMRGDVDAVIVEGAHDMRALRGYGFDGPILMCASTRLPESEFVEWVAARHRRVSVLTDFDRQGTHIHRRLAHKLERRGVRVDRRYRQSLRELLRGTGFRTIESLHGLKRRASE